MTRNEPVKVLLVVDSECDRNVLCNIIELEAGFELVGQTSDPFIALGRLFKVNPDVLILDVEFTLKKGLAYLQRLKNVHPVPLVVCSSHPEFYSRETILSLEYGAVEVINKPAVNSGSFFEEHKIMLLDRIRAAVVSRRTIVKPIVYDIPPKLTADAIIPLLKHGRDMKERDTVILIGASTGGTEALKVLLERLPPEMPGLVIVQHMPEFFTNAFAQRLDGLCRIRVKEAEQNDPVLRGQALIAPGDKHILLAWRGDNYHVRLKDGPLVCRHRPAVDVLFRSAANCCGKNAIGVILTGMGDDGAAGMLELRKVGAFTIAQDEQSCMIFGMPQEAIKRGAVKIIMPLDRISGELILKTRVNFTA